MLPFHSDDLEKMVAIQKSTVLKFEKKLFDADSPSIINLGFS